MRSGGILIAGLSLASRFTLTTAALTRIPISQCLTEYGTFSIIHVPTYIATCTITSILTELDSPVPGYATPIPQPLSRALLAQGSEAPALHLSQAEVYAVTLPLAEHLAPCRLPSSGNLPSDSSHRDHTHRMNNHHFVRKDEGTVASSYATSVICTRTITRIERVPPTPAS